MEEVKRGRPPKELKKGNSSWQPASVTDVTNKDPNFRYRWAHKDPTNLQKKEQEGWEYVNGLSSDKTSPTDGRITDGHRMTAVHEKHDLVLMRLSEEQALGRDDYYNEKSARSVAGLTAHIKKDLGKEGAETHGTITVSSRQGT